MREAMELSASGMATGGRILHHMRRFLPEESTRVLFVDYQARGTRCRALLDGADDLKIHGQYVPVRASRTSRGLSAHADYAELTQWLEARTFVTHGEAPAADALRRGLVDARLRRRRPDDGSRWTLD